MVLNIKVQSNEIAYHSEDTMILVDKDNRIYRDFRCKESMSTNIDFDIVALRNHFEMEKPVLNRNMELN